MLKHDSRTDEYLIEQYNRGKTSAFTALYERYQKLSYAFLQRKNISKSNADDVFQTVWSTIINKTDDFVVKIRRSDPPFKFKSYLYKMLQNACVDIARQNAKFDPIDDEGCNLNLLSPSVESTLIDEEKLKIVLKVIESLPQLQKETFLLIKEHGFSLEEVAEFLGISIETAKTRRRYAYEKVKSVLESMK